MKCKSENSGRLFLFKRKMNKSFDYVVHSTDEQSYNRIRCNLPHPSTNYSRMIVTTLTTVCRMLLIENGDSITISRIKPDTGTTEYFTYKFTKDYTNIDTSNFLYLFNELMKTNNANININAGIDNAERITIYSNQSFSITNISHRLKLLFGLYNIEISNDKPLKSIEHEAEPIPEGEPPNEILTIKSKTYYSIDIHSVGYTLLTPVMYLLSNIGEQCFRTIDQNLVSGMRVVMKINNSFSYGAPIIHPNGDFDVQIPSGDLTSLEFVLVDAFMKEVKLLSPMFLTIHVTAVDEEQLVPHPLTATYNAPVYYDIIPRNRLITKEEDKQPQFTEAMIKQMIEDRMEHMYINDDEKPIIPLAPNEVQFNMPGYVMNKPNVPRTHRKHITQMKFKNSDKEPYTDIKTNPKENLLELADELMNDAYPEIVARTDEELREQKLPGYNANQIIITSSKETNDDKNKNYFTLPKSLFTSSNDNTNNND